MERGSTEREPMLVGSEGEKEEISEMERGRRFGKRTEEPLYSEVDDEGNVYVVSQEELFYFDSPLLQSTLIRPDLTS